MRTVPIKSKQGKSQPVPGFRFVTNFNKNCIGDTLKSVNVMYDTPYIRHINARSSTLAHYCEYYTNFHQLVFLHFIHSYREEMDS